MMVFFGCLYSLDWTSILDRNTRLNYWTGQLVKLLDLVDLLPVEKKSPCLCVCVCVLCALWNLRIKDTLAEVIHLIFIIIVIIVR